MEAITDRGFRARALFPLLLAAAALHPGCAADPSDRHADDDVDDGGSDGDTDSDTDGDTDTDDDGCSEDAKPVYVIDGNDTLYRFDPPEKAFVPIGEIDCPSFANPFSMSVTRDAVAHVLLQDGRLNRVSTQDAACEEITQYVPDSGGFFLFGMGYATDGPDTEEETLYIGDEASLGYIDETTWQPFALGPTSGNPELTGTGAGELWGFFPTDAPPHVSRLDKGTAEVLESFPLPELSSDANAWAFAFWGGAFYIFYKTFDDPSTTVYKLEDGVLETYMADTGKYIVGAGVSTCAPLDVE
jgi:hypothetical protein